MFKDFIFFAGRGIRNCVKLNVFDIFSVSVPKTLKFTPSTDWFILKADFRVLDRIGCHLDSKIVLYKITHEMQIKEILRQPDYIQI